MSSNAVLVLGKTGSGKSTSIENLDPSETFIINVVGKELPFKGGRAKYNSDKKNYLKAHGTNLESLFLLQALTMNKPKKKSCQKEEKSLPRRH